MTDYEIKCFQGSLEVMAKVERLRDWLVTAPEADEVLLRFLENTCAPTLEAFLDDLDAYIGSTRVQA